MRSRGMNASTMSKATDRSSNPAYQPGVHSSVSSCLVQDAKDLWNERGIELADDQAKEAVSNLIGFFHLLIEWDRKSKGEI